MEQLIFYPKVILAIEFRDVVAGINNYFVYFVEWGQKRQIRLPWLGPFGLEYLSVMQQTHANWSVDLTFI